MANDNNQLETKQFLGKRMNQKCSGKIIKKRYDLKLLTNIEESLRGTERGRERGK